MSKIVIKRADKPINCNNKQTQAVVLIVWPEEELYTEVTPLHTLRRPTAQFSSQGI